MKKNLLNYEVINIRIILTAIILLCLSGAIIGCDFLGPEKFILEVEINEEKGGRVKIDPLEEEYIEGSKVTLTAVPEEGWQFHSWEGDASGTEKSITITMDDNKEIQAFFERKQYSLHLTVVGEGEVEKEVIASPQGEYKFETVLQLTAVPAQGWKFSGWEGEKESSEPVIEIEMDDHKELTAVFEREQYTLTINVEGSGAVHIDPEQEKYSFGDKVTLAAEAEPGWEFDNWEGDISRTDKEIEVEMEKDLEVIARFSAKEYYLQVEIEGEGTVEQDPYQESYKYGEEVNLTALPEEGWEFSSWQGHLNTQKNPLIVTIEDDMELTAVFSRKEYQLEVKTSGEGTVAVDPEQEKYDFGMVVNLQASPAKGWYFQQWEGDGEGSDKNLKITIDGDKEITAVFARQQYSLDLNIEGEGEIEKEVLKLPAGDYEYETLIKLTAVPAGGWEFNTWQGDATGTEKTIEVLMDGDKEITAVFSELTFSLTVDIQGSGGVDIDPEKDAYKYGEEVKLTAVPEEEWVFSHWEGDTGGPDQVQIINMTQDKDITAVFAKPGTAAGEIKIEHNWPGSIRETNLTSRYAEKPLPGDLSREEQKEEYQENQMIIGFHTIATQSQKKDIFQARNLEVLDRMKNLNAYLVRATGDNLYSKIQSIESLSAVAYAEPNYLAHTLLTVPDDEYYDLQWHYPQIRLPQAWSITTGSSSIRIAVLDTGVDTEHPDLGSNVDSDDGFNFVNDNTDTNDWNNHGTHVAGTIGANTDNSRGIAGVMWDCTIIPVKVLGDKGSGTYWDIARGISYAAGLLEEPTISQPVQIVNLSLGGSSYSEALADAVKAAADAGVIMVAASGNSGGPLLYPARFPEVIAVGAVDFNYPGPPQRAPYSSYGNELDLVAPGGNLDRDSDDDGNPDGVLSTAFPRNASKDYGYYFFEGTSMAAPHVAGVIGLMLERGICPADVREIIQRTSLDLGNPGFDPRYGHGLINAFWAVNDVQSIRILVGRREGNTIDAVLEKETDLRAADYFLENIPPGEFRIYAWIDVRGNNIIEPGDYLAETEVIEFDGTESVLKNLILTEEE